MTAPADGTALYRIWGDADLLLYIGVSDRFGTRWREHAKRQPWWDEMRRLSVDAWYESRAEAEEAETAAIKAEKPKYNKRDAVPAPERPKPKQARRKQPAPAKKPALDINCVIDGFRPWVPGFRGFPEAHDLFCKPGACLGRAGLTGPELEAAIRQASDELPDEWWDEEPEEALQPVPVVGAQLSLF